MIDAILCDLDGTLALRDPKIKRKFFGEGYEELLHTDLVNLPVLELLQAARNGWVFAPHIVFMSGRMKVGRDETVKWLREKCGIEPRAGSGISLFMREDEDTRLDYIVKRELYDTHVKGKYNIVLALDDRPSVVEMWRNELHLPCWAVRDYE